MTFSDLWGDRNKKLFCLFSLTLHIYVAYGLCFCNFSLIRIHWCAVFVRMSCWCKIATLRFVVMSCSHVVTLRLDVINDVIWHMCWAYKRPNAASLRVHSWFISRWVRRYMCMHRLMCWHTRTGRAYFLQTYLIGLLSLLRKHLPPRMH